MNLCWPQIPQNHVRRSLGTTSAVDQLRLCCLGTLHAQGSPAVWDINDRDIGKNPDWENTSQFLLIPAKIMFWPQCLERKFWNDPFFWLYNPHKSLKEASQGNFPRNISSGGGGSKLLSKVPLFLAAPAAHQSTVRRTQECEAIAGVLPVNSREWR